MYDPNLPKSRVFLPAIMSGVLLYLCYFPVNLGLLAWVALVPLLTLLRANARPRRIYFATFVGGLAFYVPAIQWMRVAHPAMYGAWLFLAVCCAFFLVMSMWLARRLNRAGMPFWLGVPIAFVAMEYFRSHFPSGYTWLEWFNARNPIGFGWYMLGHTQHEWAALIQISDLAGVYAVSFLVAMVNVAVWSATGRIANGVVIPNPTTGFKLYPFSVRPAVVAAVLVGLAVLYGTLRLQHDPYPDGPQVALIQGDLPQDIKNTHGQQMAEHFESLADQAVHPPVQTRRPDLVVWPETSYTESWFEFTPDVVDRQGVDYDFQRYANLMPKILGDEMRLRWRTPTLFGLSTYQCEGDRRIWRYNSALLLDKDGKKTGRYDKMHLVPLGEYVPAAETLPFMRWFTPYDNTEYSCKPGSLWTRFPLTAADGQAFHFACIICYEDTDATLARQYVRPGAEGVDFFVNISNDGWFQGTEQHEQHLAIDRFRAVETRRSVVRAVNMGISAIVDPDGQVVALPGPTWHESKKVAAVVRGAVPIGSGTTLYARLGDWLPVACWLVIFGGAIRGIVRRRRVVAPAAA